MDISRRFVSFVNKTTPGGLIQSNGIVLMLGQQIKRKEEFP